LQLPDRRNAHRIQDDAAEERQSPCCGGKVKGEGHDFWGER
jgi:hypothetical protein